MRQLPLVFLHGPWRLAMGLNALDTEDWLWVDDCFAAETAERARLIASRRDEVLALLPGAEPAAEELLATVGAFMARYGHTVRPADPREAPPLARLGALAQEDFCLLQPREPDGAYALTGAVLCFPAHWRLREKLGRPLGEIHDPVPGFAERLGAPVERFFRNLKVERPVWRANWTVVESPELFHPGGRQPVPGLSAEDAGERLWLRVERQTLRRLPATGAVVFGIRSLLEPLARTVRRPGAARAMAERFAEMDAGAAAYKGLPLMREPLLAYLRRHAEEPGGVVSVAQDDPARSRQRGTA
jgi:hypothetical protein